MRTEKPTLRITKWLGRNIPLEAECTSCADVQFKVGHDPRQNFHQPDGDYYRKMLRTMFDEHSKLVHPSLEPNRRASGDKQ